MAMGSPCPHLVFVYGTLKSGEPNHHVLQDPSNGKKELVGVGETASKYPLVVASRYNIPYLLDAAGTGLNVKGKNGPDRTIDNMFVKITENDSPNVHD